MMSIFSGTDTQKSNKLEEVKDHAIESKSRRNERNESIKKRSKSFYNIVLGPQLSSPIKQNRVAPLDDDPI